MKEDYEYYWSIIIEPGWVLVGIWTIRNKSVQIISKSRLREWTDQDSLITSTDEALSESVKEFPESAKEPEKTVFGVTPSWVTEGQVKKEYLEHIRQLCTNLSLKPTGFVVLPEAIAHSLKVEDGAPLTGIIVGVHKSEIDVTVFKLGNLVGTVHVGRSVSIVDDVIEGLARFNSTESLPSKLILYDGKEEELEDLRQELIKADWATIGGEQLKMLHTPQIETIGEDKKVQAVSLSGASELEDISSIVNDDDEKTAVPQDMGFVVGKDITETAAPPHVATVPPAKQQAESLDNLQEPKPLEGESENDSIARRFKSPINFAALSGLFARIRSNKSTLPVSGLPSMSGGKSKMTRLLIPLAVILTILVGVWLFVMRAEVTVYVAPQILEQSTEVSFEVGRTSPDLGSKKLPATVASVSINGEKTKSTTGSKTVGDRAKGKVKIQNGTASEISLSASTVLVGPNGLKFSIDEAVDIPEAVSTTEPGSADIAVTADDFGSEYNLANGENFTVGNYPRSELDAVVSEELTGGSSRQITAVAQADVDSLEDDLVAELKQKGIEQLQTQAGSQQKFISDAVQVSVVDSTPSNRVGDEASSVKLTLEVKVEGLMVSQDTIDQLIGTLMNDQVPAGYILKQDQVKIELDNVEQDDELWVADMRIKANLIPVIDPDEIAAKVKGKTPSSATKAIDEIPGHSRVEIKITPPLPILSSVIPYNQGHISVEVVAER